MCLVVGSCAHGFKENSSSDVIYSSSSVTRVADSNVQLFWEAFPAGSGPLDRTTYMFTYTEPQSTSPSLEDLLEEYWKLMPKYQVSFLPSYITIFHQLSFFLSFPDVFWQRESLLMNWKY
jgi:hypothetical protein